jgi:hypothetical protein
MKSHRIGWSVILATAICMGPSWRLARASDESPQEETKKEKKPKKGKKADGSANEEPGSKAATKGNKKE